MQKPKKQTKNPKKTKQKKTKTKKQKTKNKNIKQNQKQKKNIATNQTNKHFFYILLLLHNSSVSYLLHLPTFSFFLFAFFVGFCLFFSKRKPSNNPGKTDAEGKF